ncbi:MAG TPA: CBS domain-containing protein [Spirochaetia bacterium]
MRVIVGHTNMDLDCLGSIALARLLYPGARPIRSRLIHPVARTLYNLYADHLDLGTVEDLAGQEVEELIVVDTRSVGRVREFLDAAGRLPARVSVWDHHPADASDIPGAVIREAPVGSNTTLLALEAMERGITVPMEDATIALTGVYADTGSFTHENTSPRDFEVARWLLSQGASLGLVRRFLQTLKDGSQITLFHEVLNRLTYQTVHGHLVITCYMEMERQVGGLAAVVEKVAEVESPDALFAVFFFGRENETLIVARSQRREIDVARVMGAFGGGGHAQASSALLKGAPGRQAYHALQACLKTMLVDAVSARTVMESAVVTICDAWSLRDASMFLEKADRSGAPVVDGHGRLCGYLSLRDVMKARRSGQIDAPVSSHMMRKVISGTPGMSLREIEEKFFTHTIFDIPIVEEGRIVGIVTRDAFLRARAGETALSPSGAEGACSGESGAQARY